MLRWLLLASLVVVLSVGATVAVHFLPTSPSASDGPAYPQADKGEIQGPPAKAVIVEGGDPIHEFGVMAQHTRGHKTWVIKNEGRGDLLLRKGGGSCSCTVANLAEGETARVKPGQTTEVELEWNTKANDGPFSQYAEVLTINDPNRQVFRFEAKGKVTPAVVTLPPDHTVSFLNVTSDQPHRSSFAVFSPDKPDLKITKLTTTRPDLLVATYRPMTADERKAIQIQGGYRVDVELKPGMPLGEFQEELILEDDHPQQTRLTLAVTGKVIGPISAVPERVHGRAAGSKGGVEVVTLWVRGQDRTSFDVAKSPEKLKVNIAAADEKAEGAGKAAKARRYRMTVTIPPGTPPGPIGGTIILKTNHPHAGELKIPVNVNVTSAS